MPSFIQNLQADIKNKLAFKSSSKVSSDALLFKIFKFFDMSEQGTLSFNDFFRALAKLGVVISNQQNMKSIFDHYDSKRTGKINYRQFIGSVLKLQVQGSQTLSVKSEGKETSVFQQLHSQLIVKGFGGMVDLGLRFKKKDSQMTHHVSLKQFVQVMASVEIRLKQSALTQIFRFFDKDQDGFINYAEFIYNIRGVSNSFRQGLINSVFQLLDKGNQGQVQLAFIKNNFQPYSCNQISPQQTKLSFFRALDCYNKFQGIDDGIFTLDDFQDFMGFISYCVQTDQQFRSMLTNWWPSEDRKSVRSSRSRRQFSHTQKQGKEQVKPVSNKIQIIQEKADYSKKKQSPTESRRQDTASVTTSVQAKQIQLVILRVKGRLASRGPRGFLFFLSSMKGVDSDNDGLITVAQFRRVMKDLRIDVTDSQIQQVFQLFDDQALGKIQLYQIYNTLRGFPSQKRNHLIERTWACLDKDNRGVSNFSVLKSQLNPRSHPDVKCGRKHEDDVMREVFDCILQIQTFYNSRGQQIKKQHFIQFMRNVSGSTPQDALFELVLKSLFRMPSQTRIQQHYAGSKQLFDVSKRNGYLQDHHRQRVKGGTVSQNAPFGTFPEQTDYSQRYYH